MQAKYLTSTHSACTTFSLAQNSCKLEDLLYFGLKVRIFLIIKRLKVSLRVDISKILVLAVTLHDSVVVQVSKCWLDQYNHVRPDRSRLLEFEIEIRLVVY